MRSLAAVLVSAAVAAPLAADTVYLANGNTFEEVVAERVDGEVRIRLPYGEIVLPARVVERVERSPSVWQEYLRRERALRIGAATAPEWLELARWAGEMGYLRGLRQAALRAAELDPELAGLPPLMSRIGHVLDRESGEWLPEAVYMRRHGYRLWGDHWLPAEEHAARLRAHEEMQKARRDEARQERIARAIEALVVAQLSRAAEPEPEPAPVAGQVVAFFPGGFYPHPATVSVAPVVAEADQATYDDLVERQPGSLFPVRPRRHLTSSD